MSTTASHAQPQPTTMPGYDPSPSSGLTTVVGSPVPYMSGGVIPIRRDGEDMNVTSGYRQSGPIVDVKDGIVTQNAGKSIVQYRESDLIGDAKDPDAMTKMLVPGRNIRVSVDQDHIHVADVGRDRGLSQAQQHSR